MASTWGQNVKVSIFGESHGTGIGVVIEGLPAGERISFEDITTQMNRRAPGDSMTTDRKERDIPQVMSGVINDTTTGTPLCAIFKNEDVNSADYEDHQFLPRPGHADYTGYVRYKGYASFPGGGHFSGRLTCPLVFAGAICRQILKRTGVIIGSHLSSIGDVTDELFPPVDVTSALLEGLSSERFPVVSVADKTKMQQKILEVRAEGDSIGGVVECAIIGARAGLGDPIFDGIESKISSIIFGIPGVKGIEFGSGFEATTMKGSMHNDIFTLRDGQVMTLGNNHGGILGGLSSGMPIIFKVAFKPTPSVAKQQHTVNMKEGTEQLIKIRGRHDPCIAVRAAPVVEAAAAVAMLDIIVGASREIYKKC